MIVHKVMVIQCFQNHTKVENQSEPEYINPSGKFKSTIVRDQNSTIRGIVAVQDAGIH